MGDIFSSSFGGSVFLVRVRFFSYFVRDAHSNLISADDLEYAVHRFVLIHKTLKTCNRAHVLELIFGKFPAPPFLPVGTGQN